MSQITQDLSQIRHLLTRKRDQIVKELSAKKIIGRKQCQQWIDELYDLVITYDTRSAPTPPPTQVFHQKLDIDSDHQMDDNDDDDQQPDNVWPDEPDGQQLATKQTGLKSSSTVAQTDELWPEGVDQKDKNEDQKASTSTQMDNPWPKDDNWWPEEPLVTKAMIESAGNPREGEPRFKGIIVGLDSLSNDNWDDNWEPTKDDNNNNTDSGGQKSAPVLWSSEGKVLGGETASTGGELTAEQMRQLRALKTEQRLKQLDSKGSKGLVRLPPTVDDTSATVGLLRWRM